MGRWTKERHIQEAAKKANTAAQSAAKTEAPSPAPAARDLPSHPSKPEKIPYVPPRGNPRNAAYAEIEALHAERTGQGGDEVAEPAAVETPAEAPETPPAPVEAPAAVETPAAAPAPEPVAETPTEPEPVKTSRQVVDGKEYEVPQSEIDEAGGATAWRKGKAADNRLAEAKEALAQSKRDQAAIVDYIQRTTQQQAPQPTQQQIDYSRFLQNGIEYIRQGTPEQGAQALQEILARSIPQINPADIQARAVLDIKRGAATDAFREEFPEIAANPNLMAFASALENAKLAQLNQNGALNSPQAAVGLDWKQFYRMIGNEVRSVVPRPSQPQPSAAPTPSHPSPVPDKEARKASIVNLPTAAARAELPAEDKPETREEALAAMRKKRGFPTG